MSSTANTTIAAWVRIGGMDVSKLLEAASLLVPEDIATENDITVADVWEYLTQDEWEVALGLLEELGDVQPLPLSFWEALATAAEQMRLEKSAAWCHWRCYEARNGIIRADLTLRPAADARDRRPSPAPASCDRCGTSETETRPANRPSTSPCSGLSARPSSNLAGEPR